MPLTRDMIAQRIAQELRDGYYVNLGIGIPTLVANYIPAGMSVILHSENGLLGLGPYPTEAEIDPDCVNAGKETVTATRGAAFFSSSESFAMIRGGHIDLSVLGAMEVDQQGNIANWMIPGKLVKGMGGAMDLVAGARNFVVAMQHCAPDGRSKLLKKCSLPLTGVGVVTKVVTDMAVLGVRNGKFVLLERAADVTIEQIIGATEGDLEVPDDVPAIAGLSGQPTAA